LIAGAVVKLCCFGRLIGGDLPGLLDGVCVVNITDVKSAIPERLG
jgi:hypothetical protein